MTLLSAMPRLAATQRGAVLQALLAGSLFAAALLGTITRADTPLAQREEVALRAAAEEVAESVVQIRTVGGADSIGSTLLPDGPTTGLVISADGYIVSSAFNFVQKPASILVTFASGKQVPAELVATDHSRMIVLLKAVGVADLPVPQAAPAHETRVGQWTVAVGRTFHAQRTNVSVGIVSALNRMFGKVLQTDAAVSMANYGGPLVDIRGRVLGVIVPIAPQGSSDMAGVEWYDSGIGFAVPLESILERLDEMKRGDDLHSGILGIGLAPRNPHSAAPVLAAVRPDAPAGKAGLKKGDRIVELDGQPVRTQTDLRFALGARYGGERLKIVVERGDDRIERTITLVGKLPPFRHAFLGVLPQRPVPASGDKRVGDADEAQDQEEAKPDKADEEATEGSRGVVVRMVYPGSPAETAGIEEGDRILKINGAQVDGIDSAIAELNNVAPGSEVVVQFSRGDESMERTLSAIELPTALPRDLPPGVGPQSAPPQGQAQAKQGETRELVLPEFPQKCKMYVPASYESGQPHGVVLWLHGGDTADADGIIAAWQSICDRDGLLLVVPTAAEGNRWDRSEMEYLVRLLARIISQHTIDPRRVVVCGQEAGGAMAWSLAFLAKDAVRGLAVSAAPLPRGTNVPPNEPGRRFAILAAVPKASDAAVVFNAGLQKCAEAAYPVTTISLTDEQGDLSDTEREEIARWIDTLDRF